MSEHPRRTGAGPKLDQRIEVQERSSPESSKMRGMDETHAEWRFEINHAVLIRIADALHLDYRRIPWTER